MVLSAKLSVGNANTIDPSMGTVMVVYRLTMNDVNLVSWEFTIRNLVLENLDAGRISKSNEPVSAPIVKVAVRIPDAVCCSP